MDGESKAGQLIIILILIIAFIFLLCCAAYKNKNLDTGTVHIEGSNHNIIIYNNQLDSSCSSNNLTPEQKENCDQISVTIETEVEKAEVVDIKNKNLILYRDNGLKIYNIEKNSKEDIELSEEYNHYNMILDDTTNNVVGIIYSKDKTEGYYNINLKKKLYEGKYTNLDLLDNKYIKAKLENKIALLSLTSEKQILSIANNCNSLSLNKSFIIEKHTCNDETFTIYNRDGNVIAKDKQNEYWTVDDKGNLYIEDKNIVYKYNEKGEPVSQSKQYYDVKQVIKEYIITYELNGKLLLTDDKDVNINISNWSYAYKYNSEKTGYYPQQGNHKEGIYIYFKDSDSKDRAFYFNLNNKSLEEI